MGQSRDEFLPPGNNQVYATPAADLLDPAQFNFDISAPWLRDSTQLNSDSVVPLVIVVVAMRRRSARELAAVQGSPVIEAQGQMTFARFVRSGPEVIRQVAFGDKAAHEIQGIFGFEDEGESECMVC